MDWKTLYGYPARLMTLQPGDAGVFVCPPAWRSRLATVCAIWVKANTDWVSAFPSGTQWRDVFRTEAHADGLRVVRGPVPGRESEGAPTEFRFKPLAGAPEPEPGLPRIDQVFALWRA